MLNAILIGYSILVIAALAKFYGYYNIRGKMLADSLYTPILLMVIVPILMIHLIMTKKDISVNTKFKMSCWCLYDSIFNYPENIGVLATTMKADISQSQCATKQDNRKIVFADDEKSIAAFRFIPKFYCDIHNRRLLLR